jgi:FKBP-type peptidyl-prolyl cis-trans isomerase SlyD
MQIARNRVVSLDVELSDIWGNLIDHPAEPVQYLHGDYGDIFALVEAALDAKAPNDRIDIRLEPEDSYGDYNENLLFVEPLSGFPVGLEVGMRVDPGLIPGAISGDQGEDGDSDGDGHSHSQYRRPLFYTVTDIAKDKVVLDGNHPLAGIALRFVATVVDVRPATPAEIESGAADDPSSVVLRALP